MLKYMLRVTTSMWKIIWGVVRYCDLVVKIKITKLFSGVFVGDLQKFMLTKISCYTVCAHSFAFTCMCTLIGSGEKC